MKDILSARGLAALGWLSTFGYLWAFALGLVPGGWTAAGIVLFSLLVALAAGAGIKEKAWHAETMPSKNVPPAWHDPGWQ